MPVPAYCPQLDVAEITGRERRRPRRRRRRRPRRHRPRRGSTGCLPTAPAPCCSPSRTTRGAASSAAPSSRGSATWSTRHGARVISDEIHAPLVLPGAEHVPYLSLDGTADHAVAARRLVQGVQHRRPQVRPDRDRRRRRPATGCSRVPMARNDSWSTLGVVAAVAAYDHGDPWLAALHRAARPAAHPARASCWPSTCRWPGCGRWRRPTSPGSTCGPTARRDDPARVCLEQRPGRGLAAGHDYHPGSTGHVRLNIATSPERLTEIVHRMAHRAGRLTRA